MPLYVRVLGAESTEPPPFPWPGEDLLSPRLLGEPRQEAWELLCTSVVKMSQVGVRSPVEIFICVPPGELRKPLDRLALKRLLETVRDHSWGANVFLATGKIPDRLQGLVDVKPSLEAWMRAALDGRVLDILQVEHEVPPRSAIKGKQLREAADLAARRHPRLSVLHQTTTRWRCVVDLERIDLKRPLSAWLYYEGLEEAEPPNVLVVVDEWTNPVACVKKARRRYGECCRAVATLKRPSTELRDFCAEKGLGEPFEFGGELELWYFLLRLNADRFGIPDFPSVAAQVSTMEPAADAEGRLHEVMGAGARVFREPEPSDESVVVVTSAFDPGEPKQCLAAAKDVGSLMQRYPLGAPLVVEPAISLGGIFELIDRVQSFDVWIHLGHGAGLHGLWDVDGKLATPEQWLRCFMERNCRLSLAVFLTCSSAPIARLFAESGAGVAIGFENPVESHMCRQLLVDVFASAVSGGLSQSEILQGFRRGYLRITNQEEIESRPIAYYLRQP